MMPIRVYIPPEDGAGEQRKAEEANPQGVNLGGTKVGAKGGGQGGVQDTASTKKTAPGQGNPGNSSSNQYFDILIEAENIEPTNFSIVGVFYPCNGSGISNSDTDDSDRESDGESEEFHFNCTTSNPGQSKKGSPKSQNVPPKDDSMPGCSNDSLGNPHYDGIMWNDAQYATPYLDIKFYTTPPPPVEKEDEPKEE